MGELLDDLKQVPMRAAAGVMTDIWLVLACVLATYDKPGWVALSMVLCLKVWVFMRSPKGGNKDG